MLLQGDSQPALGSWGPGGGKGLSWDEAGGMLPLLVKSAGEPSGGTANRTLHGCGRERAPSHNADLQRVMSIWQNVQHGAHLIEYARHGVLGVILTLRPDICGSDGGSDDLSGPSDLLVAGRQSLVPLLQDRIRGSSVSQASTVISCTRTPEKNLITKHVVEDLPVEIPAAAAKVLGNHLMSTSWLRLALQARPG